MLSIPPDPTSEGKLKVDLWLSTEEWHGVTSRLKDVLARLRAQNESLSHQGTSSGVSLEQERWRADGLAAGQSLPAFNDWIPSSLEQTAIALQTQASPARSQGAVHAVCPLQAATPQQLSSPQPGYKAHQHALPGSGLPAALQAALSSSALLPSQQASQAHHHQPYQAGQTKHSKQGGAVLSEQAAHPAIPAQLWDSAPAPKQALNFHETGSWATVWRTDDTDNNGVTINCLAHVPSLPGLPGGDGHAGYLISAANQSLNLYECSASGGRGEASLQLMHQLSTETQISMLAVEPGNLLLLASAQDAGRPTRCVAMHSLDPERGLFRPCGRVPLPPIGSPVPKAETLTLHKPQVASLHGLGGPLTGCLAASSGPSLVVYSTKCAPGEIPKPKAHWQAHSAPVTNMHTSQYGMQLWSGAQDGSMHAWDLHYKPSQPTMKLHQVGPVRALSYVREHCLQSGSSDGSVHLWDVRSPRQALHSLRMPDSGGVTASALSPFRDILVVGTDNGGVFAVSVADEQYSITQCERLEAPVSHICWNMGTGEVYAAAAARIAVLRQS